MSIVRLLLLASFTACAVQAPEPSTGQNSQMLRSEDDPPGDDPGGGGGGGGPPSDLECAAQGGLCAIGVGLAVPACVPECATVAGCVVCGGTLALALAPCASWHQECFARAAQVGDACTVSYRCETNGLHCVDGACRTSLGNENQGCTSNRDCQPNTTCVNGEGGAHFCFRPRQVGESCQSGECALDDGNGHPLTCDAASHQCRRQDACSVNADCARGTKCNSGTCVPGCDDDNQCLAGDACVAGGCTHTDVTVCNCDGTDAPGTCIGACGGGGGGGGEVGGGGWLGGTTCYAIYDSYTVCANYGNQQSCETTYELVDSFCD